MSLASSVRCVSRGHGFVKLIKLPRDTCPITRGLSTSAILSERKWKYHPQRDLKPPVQTENVNMPEKHRSGMIQLAFSEPLIGQILPIQNSYWLIPLSA